MKVEDLHKKLVGGRGQAIALLADILFVRPSYPWQLSKETGVAISTVHSILSAWSGRGWVAEAEAPPPDQHDGRNVRSDARWWALTDLGREGLDLELKQRAEEHAALAKLVARVRKAGQRAPQNGRRQPARP